MAPLPKLGTLGAHLKLTEKRDREKGRRGYCGSSNIVRLLCGNFDMELEGGPSGLPCDSGVVTLMKGKTPVNEV